MYRGKQAQETIAAKQPRNVSSICIPLYQKPFHNQAISSGIKVFKQSERETDDGKRRNNELENQLRAVREELMNLLNEYKKSLHLQGVIVS